MTEIVLASPRIGAKLRRYLRLAKPRVVSLIVFCAVIGMLLATPDGVPLPTLLAATLGALAWFEALRGRRVGWAQVHDELRIECCLVLLIGGIEDDVATSLCGEGLGFERA